MAGRYWAIGLRPDRLRKYSFITPSEADGVPEIERSFSIISSIREALCSAPARQNSSV
jgi:hypothetical protein